MLAAIRSLLRKYSVAPVDDTLDGERGLRMAVAMLLLDVARADTEITAEERRVARQLLERFFPVRSI